MRHRRVYEMLKHAGHSPAKAIEIIFDASRGKEHALVWIRLIHQMKQRIAR